MLSSPHRVPSCQSCGGSSNEQLGIVPLVLLSLVAQGLAWRAIGVDSQLVFVICTPVECNPFPLWHRVFTQRMPAWDERLYAVSGDDHGIGTHREKRTNLAPFCGRLFGRRVTTI